MSARGPQRFESTDTLRIDREELRRATESEAHFEEWSAGEIARAVATSSIPPPPAGE